MEECQTRYVKSGDAYIAYQVFGEGPLDLIYTGGLISHVDLVWDFPEVERFLMRLASFCRVILFDGRGTGVSDRVCANEVPSLEDWAADVMAVMDAAQSSQAVLFAERDAGPMAMAFAAAHPQCVSSLILCNTSARYGRTEGYDCGEPPEQAEQFCKTILEHWGTDRMVAVAVPSRAGDANFLRMSSRYQRAASTPRVAAEKFRYSASLDVRDCLSRIQCPTLVMHRSRYPFLNPGHAAYLHKHIAGAQSVGVEGADAFFAYDRADVALGHIEEFLTGARGQSYAEKVVLTVLFVDIAGSTTLAAKIGDGPWRDLLERFHGMVRKELHRFGGHEVDTSGDGFFATFDAPARALHCAYALRDEAKALGLTVREGLHAGECEMAGEAVRGLAVHIGARVLGEARDGEIWVSRTIKDLVAGSSFEFKDEGSRELKGVPGYWRVFALEKLAREEGEQLTKRDKRRRESGRESRREVAQVAVAGMHLADAVLDATRKTFKS
jgi:class 3 adenylate cyclase/pimeloyl-ACP methyl ester carboxylesterase